MEIGSMNKGLATACAVLSLVVVVSCGKSKDEQNARPMDISQKIKNSPMPPMPDTSKYASNTVARDSEGKLLPPWREVYSCDDKGNCTTKIMNEVTKVVANEIGQTETVK